MIDLTGSPCKTIAIALVLSTIQAFRPGADGLALAQSDATTTDSTTAETPSWKLGIPSFNASQNAMDAGKAVLQKASAFQLPSYVFKKQHDADGATAAVNPEASAIPAAVDASTVTASTVTANLADGNSPGTNGTAPANATASSDSGVSPTAYQVDPLALGTPIQNAGTPSMELPALPSAPPQPPAIAEAPSGPIGAAVASGVYTEATPLAPQTTSWYEVPWRWLRDGWENHAELGIDGSNGNAETFALQTGIEMKRKTDTYTLALDFDYRKATTSELTTEDNGRFNADYDRLFDNSPWAAFGKFGMEWDKFKAFDLRLNVNGGLGYHFIRTDDTELVTRFGAGASKEIGAPDDDWKAEAVFGLEGERQLNRYNKMKAKVEYFPEWSDFANYRLVTDLAWEILLDDSDNLSLKLALTDRYDSTPQGAKANDVYYSMLLLVKF